MAARLGAVELALQGDLEVGLGVGEWVSENRLFWIFAEGTWTDISMAPPKQLA